MLDRQDLERKLKNRSSKNDLYDKGIIQHPNMSPMVVEQINQLKKSSVQNMMSHKISTRPSKQDLVSRGILDGQDYETTSQVKKHISEHLISRPGPLDVIPFLVPNETNENNPQVSRSPLTPYMLAKKLLQCKSGFAAAVQDEACPQIIKKLNARKNGGKTRNITFHEFVPGKSGSNGYFIRSDTDKNRSTPNRFTCLDHYRQLIEQQAMFLQMELEDKKSENSKENILSQHQKGTTINDLDPESLSNTVPVKEMKIKDYNVDFLARELEKSHYAHDINEDMFKEFGFLNSNDIFFCDDDAMDDPLSSGYGTTSLQTSESYGIEQNYHLGFGLFHDCDSFNSVYEKIEMYEKLYNSANNRS